MIRSPIGLSCIIFILIGTALGEIVDKEAILAVHNAERAAVGASDILPLVWDDALATAADAYAQTCSSDHSTNRAGAGENLAWGTPDGTAASELWASEKKNFDMTTKSCGAIGDCGHYQQMIWATTTRIGCGMGNCASGALPNPHKMWVCQYSPGGNVVGSPAYGGAATGSGSTNSSSNFIAVTTYPPSDFVSNPTYQPSDVVSDPTYPASNSDAASAQAADFVDDSWTSDIDYYSDPSLESDPSLGNNDWTLMTPEVGFRTSKLRFMSAAISIPIHDSDEYDAGRRLRKRTMPAMTASPQSATTTTADEPAPIFSSLPQVVVPLSSVGVAIANDDRLDGEPSMMVGGPNGVVIF